jgi:hypothetical protein
MPRNFETMSETLSSPKTQAPTQTVTSPIDGPIDSTIIATPASSSSAPAVLYCANHPDTETLLRCNRCEKPICLRCAVLTDVGYRCKECIRGVQSSYFNAIPMDNVIGFGVALLVTAIASPIAGFLFAFVPFFLGIILAFAIGSGAGGALAQIIRAAVGRRRGRYLRHFTLAGIVLGVMIGGFVGLLFGIPVFSLTTLAFTVLSTATAYQILR